MSLILQTEPISIFNNMTAKTRNTKQRQIILDELMGNKCHPTADEIYAEVRKKLPRVSLSTIYRNLDFLQRDGKIRAIDVGGEQRRYDYITDDHLHIRCVQCGRIEDIRVDPPDCIIEECAQCTDFEVLGCNYDIYGICPECKNEDHKQKEE